MNVRAGSPRAPDPRLEVRSYRGADRGQLRGAFCESCASCAVNTTYCISELAWIEQWASVRHAELNPARPHVWADTFTAKMRTMPIKGGMPYPGSSLQRDVLVDVVLGANIEP